MRWSSVRLSEASRSAGTRPFYAHIAGKADFPLVKRYDIVNEEPLQILRDCSKTAWSTYVIGAFQGPTGQDGDQDSEAVLLGASDKGVSMIYYEDIVDLGKARPGRPTSGHNISAKLRDTVIHEVGHMLSGLDHNPGPGLIVTEWLEEPGLPGRDFLSAAEEMPTDWFSHYTKAYLKAIRKASKPLS